MVSRPEWENRAFRRAFEMTALARLLQIFVGSVEPLSIIGNWICTTAHWS
jgi:hypothetical protein